MRSNWATGIRRFGAGAGLVLMAAVIGAAIGTALGLALPGAADTLAAVVARAVDILYNSR